jgi:hypothetical protein
MIGTEEVMENIAIIVNEHSEALTERLISAMHVGAFDDASMTLDVSEEE